MPKKAEPTGFADRLKELREAAGLTQDELADKAGLYKFSIAKLEQGVREPTWGTVLVLAKALGLSVADFVTEAGSTFGGQAFRPTSTTSSPSATEESGGEAGNRHLLTGPHMVISCEKLAYWYLRLNGFLMIPGFIVHPDRGSNQETEIDLLAVRFPHRAENLLKPMKDNKLFTDIKSAPFIVFGEVTKGQCKLNAPWKNQTRMNMLRFLYALGPFPKAEAETAANKLYEVGFYSCQLYRVSLLFFGESRDPELEKQFPDVPQIVWDDVKGFIYKRFREYRSQKRSHGQWDESGKNLWNASEASKDEAQFMSSVTVTDKVPATTLLV